MNSINSEDIEEKKTKEEETTLRDEIIALRNEIKSLKDDIKGKEEVETIQKPVIRKVLKCYRETGVSKDLDVRRMVITPDDKYLITCSEIQLGKKPRVCVWSLDKILQKIEKEQDILKGRIKADDHIEFGEEKNGVKKETGNWLLCVDALTAKINEKDIWIVCTGSIEGDIYIWAGEIDKKSKEWNLTPLFDHKYSEKTQIQKAIFDIKILPGKIEDKQDDNLLKDGFKIYYSSNTIGVYSKEKTESNYIGELHLIPDSKEKINFRIEPGLNFSEEKEWILTFEIYDSANKSFLITGSNDNNIYKWDLKTGERESLIGRHENGITCVKISNDGNRVASGCLDNDIKVWDLEDGTCILEKYEHTKEIVSIAFQEDGKYLITASKDNIIKVWNITDEVMVRNIDLNKEMENYNKFKQQKKNLQQQDDKKTDPKPKLKLKKYGPGLDYLRQILLSPKDQYIFTIKKNKILVLRNYGRIWHFYQQLKHLEENFPKLYKKIYGPNLKQIARNLEENEESFKELYNEIKRRLEEPPDAYNPRILGPLFIPSFVKYEDNEENQKIYINSVRTNYESYWYSATKMIHEIPDLQWKFKLFLTTDIENQIEKANYIEVTNFTSSKKKEKPFIILKDRTQSQIRYLMVLDRVPTTFIPLLKSVILDIEDDRGDKDKLIFTDFKLSHRRKEKLMGEKREKKKGEDKDIDGFPLNILKKPYKSLKAAEPYRDLYKSDESFPKRFYYSHCIFKLDERYSVKASATINVRKITVEMTESLNPFESKKKVKGDIELFEAFRNNFHSPPTPKVNIKIGKGLMSAGGKILDKYLAGLVTLDFLFTIISVLILYREIFDETGYLNNPLGMSLFVLNIFVSTLFVVVLIWILINPVKDFMIRRKLGRPGIVTN